MVLANVPNILNAKYTLEPKTAFSIEWPQRSIRSLGTHTFIPTSIPAAHTAATKNASTVRFFSKPNTSFTEEQAKISTCRTGTNHKQQQHSKANILNKGNT